jgi:TusA-related sulfurtransferase
MLENNNTSTRSIELMPDTLAGIIDWDTLDQIWYAIQHSEHTQWYFHNNDASTAGYDRLNDVNTSGDISAALTALKDYLRQSHPRDYCGLAFADSLTEPTLIRVFDPKYLTSMCNIYGNTPAPSWVISTMDAAQLASKKMTSSKLQNHSSGKALPNAPKHPQIADSLDARRMGCPLPLVHTSRSLRRLAVGEILEIVTIDPGSVNDIEYLCKCTGSKHIALAEGEYGYSFYIERGLDMKTNNVTDHTNQGEAT